MVVVSDMKLLPRRTQLERDNSATAIAGSIASAIRFLVKQILTESLNKGLPNLGDPQLLPDLSRNSKGLGEPLITAFLRKVPGIKNSVVEEQLANLKKSGDYARIDPPHLTISLYKKG